MPYKIGWYLPERVFFIEIFGEVTIEEVREIVLLSQNFHRPEGPDVIHSVTNTLRMKYHTHNLNEIMGVVRRAGVSFDNLGWNVMVIHPNPFLSFVLSAVGQMFGFRFRMAGSVEEGLALLNKFDDSLPPLLPLRVDYLEQVGPHDDSN